MENKCQHTYTSIDEILNLTLGCNTIKQRVRRDLNWEPKGKSTEVTGKLYEDSKSPKLNTHGMKYCDFLRIQVEKIKDDVDLNR